MDYEAQQSYELTITANDGTNTVQISFMWFFNNKNKSPSILW